MADNINIVVNETIENIVVNPSINTDIIDVNIAATTEAVDIAVTPNLTTININTITGNGLVTSVNGEIGDVIIPTSDNNYTTAEKNKLAGIASGAEVNVNADWNATSGDAQILNKPTITTANITAISPITSTNGANAVISTAITTNKLIGRYSSGTGVMEEITLGTGLSLNSSGTLNAAASSPTGYFGAFQDMLTQSLAAINVGQPFLIRTTDESNQVSITANGSGQLTRITPANTGVYNIQWSGQFQNPDNAIHDVNVWFRKGLTSSSGSGTDVVGSNGVIALPARKSASAGDQGHTVAGWNFLLSIAAGEYVEFYWMSDSTLITLQAYPAGSPPPSTASLIVTVTQQAGIMAGTGITAINSLTGASQTLGIGTSGLDFNIISTGTSHTFNLPTASATNRGALSTTDWTAFNGKFTLPSLTSGSVLFSNGTTIAQDNTNFFWDDTNKRLNIGGIASNTARVGIKAPGALSTDIAFKVRNSTDTADLMTLSGNGDVTFGTTTSGIANFPWKIIVGGSGGASQFNTTVNITGFLNVNNANQSVAGLNTTRLNAQTDLSIGFQGGAATSSIVEIQSTTKGFLPPRMTNAQRIAIATPAIGLVVYCIDATEGLYENTSAGWINLNAVVTNRQTSSYTLALTDTNKLVETNVATANNLTIPISTSINFPIGTKINIVQYGAGQTTIVATSGVTIRSANNWLKINAQYGAATLTKIATDEWYLWGNLNA